MLINVNNYICLLRVHLRPALELNWIWVWTDMGVRCKFTDVWRHAAVRWWFYFCAMLTCKMDCKYRDVANEIKKTIDDIKKNYMDVFSVNMNFTLVSSTLNATIPYLSSAKLSAEDICIWLSFSYSPSGRHSLSDCCWCSTVNRRELSGEVSTHSLNSPLSGYPFHLAVTDVIDKIFF